MRNPPTPSAAPSAPLGRVAPRAFTLVELLVVVSIIAILIAIIVPSLGSATEQSRVTGCSAKLKNLGTALRQYMNDNDERLPSLWIDMASTPTAIVPPTESGSVLHIGDLFAGTLGDLGGLGIDEIGPARRPLNSYLGVKDPPGEPPDPTAPAAHGDAKFEVDAVLDPADRGIDDPLLNTMLDPDDVDARERRYELLGTSYVLNEVILLETTYDPTAGAQEVSTLVPQEFENGRLRNEGRRPRVSDPGKTWLAGDGPIHNYQFRSDRKQHWHFPGASKKAKDYVEANLLFNDFHVGSRLRVPSWEAVLAEPAVTGVPNPLRYQANVRPEYTFLPDPDWALTRTAAP